MRSHSLLILGMIGLTFGSGHARAAVCPPALETIVEVSDEVTLLGPLQNMSDEELSATHKAGFVPFSTNEVWGVTRNTFFDGGDFDYAIEPADDQGNVCIHMRKITLNLRLESEINIRRSIIPGSCEYDVVLEHEMRHAKNAKEAYGKARENFASHMKEFFLKTPNAFVSPSGIEFYKAELDKKIVTYLNALSEEAWINIREEAGKIDTYMEYRRVNNACK